jgi:hypothetical protein
VSTVSGNQVALRVHRVLWLAVTLLTGLLAGFLLSHSVMLGRYFSWLIRSGNYRVFTDTFSQFRLATRANVHYNLFLWVSLAAGAGWVVSSFVVRKDRVVAVVAGLSSLWVGCVFFASGFAEAEEAVSTGVAGEALQQFFVSWNVPLHASFAAFYTACFLLLLLSGRRGESAGRERM